MAAVLEARRRELASMREYVDTDTCRMAFLGRLLNDPAAGECGHCANDGGVRWPRSVSPALVQEAVAYLRRDVRAIEPRKQWPEGARIAKPTESGGRCASWATRGGGGTWRAWSASAGPGAGPPRFEDHLAGAAMEVIRGRWRPNADAGVGDLRAVRCAAGAVEAFAQRLASVLGLPFAAVRDVRRRRAAGADGRTAPSRPRTPGRSWASSGGRVAAGPVLLVDDLVDSRWTLTVAGSLLREAGAGRCSRSRWPWRRRAGSSRSDYSSSALRAGARGGERAWPRSSTGGLAPALGPAPAGVPAPRSPR